MPRISQRLVTKRNENETDDFASLLNHCHTGGLPLPSSTASALAARSFTIYDLSPREESNTRWRAAHSFNHSCVDTRLSWNLFLSYHGPGRLISHPIQEYVFLITCSFTGHMCFLLSSKTVFANVWPNWLIWEGSASMSPTGHSGATRPKFKVQPWQSKITWDSNSYEVHWQILLSSFTLDQYVINNNSSQ